MRKSIEALEPRRLLSASPYAGPLHVVGDLSAAQQMSYVGFGVIGALATLEGVSGAEQLKPGQLPRATVHWGDGSGAQRLDILASGASSIDASAFRNHIYRRAGTFTIKTAFYFHSRRLGEVRQSINVQQNSSGGTTIRAVVGQQFTQVLGTVPTASTASEGLLGADWGDGSGHSSVTIQNDNGTTEQLVASHVYRHPGTYRVIVRQPMSGSGELGFAGPILLSTAIILPGKKVP